MAAVINAVQARRCLRRERVLRDRMNPLVFYNDSQLHERYRFTRKSIDYIVGLLSDSIVFTSMRNMCLPPLYQVMIALRFLACGSFLVVVGDTVPVVSKATVCRCVRRVCLALAALARRFILMPTGQQRTKTKRRFFDIKGFPNVIGAIDCTHVKIKAPSGDREPDFVNRKGHHSLNIQAVCNSQHEITNLVVKWPGSVYESRIFNESSLYQTLKNDNFDGFLLGDGGYGLKSILLTPYSNPITPAQWRYNAAHTRTRVVIEQSFGIIKNRFQCLRHLRMTPERAVPVITSCFILHDIAVKTREINRDDLLDVTFENNIQDDDDDNGTIIRSHVTNLFFER